MIWFL